MIPTSSFNRFGVGDNGRGGPVYWVTHQGFEWNL